MQLIWSRCIHTQGRQGANIACDLHMEHLNRRLKNVLRGMSSNITPARVQRTGQSIQLVYKVCEMFEKQSASRLHCVHHPYPAFGKDFQSIIKVLLDEDVFEGYRYIDHTHRV